MSSNVPVFLRPEAISQLSQTSHKESTVIQSPETQSWWIRLFTVLRRYNPLSWFFRWLSSNNLISRFLNWIRQKVSPATWGLVKDAASRGAMAAVGGVGSALVQKFMETKDGKWDRALSGGTLPQNGMFQGGSVVPVNKTVTSFGYGAGSAPAGQPAYTTNTEGFPFGH